MSIKKIKTYIIENKWILLFAVIYSSLIFYLSPVNLPISDSATYADIAKNLVKNSCFCSNFEVDLVNSPGFPIMLAVSMVLFGDFFMKALPAIISFLLILSSFHLAREITNNKKTALIAPVFLVTTPLVFYNSLRILSDVPFLLLTILSIFMYVKFLKKRDTRFLLLWGFFTGFAFLIRFTGFLLAVIFLLHLVLLRAEKKKFPLKFFIYFLIIASLVVSPWFLWRFSQGYLHEFTVAETLSTESRVGHFVLKIENLVLETGEPLNLNTIDIDTYLPIQITNFLRICAILIVFVTPMISIITVHKLYKYLKGKREKFDGLLLTWLLIPLAFHTLLPAAIDSRYLLFLVPPMVMFFSQFLVNNWKKMKILVILIITIQIFSSVLIIDLDSKTRWTRGQTEVFMEAGEWIKANTDTDSQILCLGFPCPTVNYYGERKSIKLNKDKIPDYIAASNYGEFEPTVEETMASIGRKYKLLKTFSDDKYYFKIYGQ